MMKNLDVHTTDIVYQSEALVTVNETLILRLVPLQ